MVTSGSELPRMTMSDSKWQRVVQRVLANQSK